MCILFILIFVCSFVCFLLSFFLSFHSFFHLCLFVKTKLNFGQNKDDHKK